LVATDVAARGLGKYYTAAQGLNYVVLATHGLVGSPAAISHT